MPKASVIMPVCNVEEYLRQCVDSVLKQTMQDIEVVCVDDGSTDGSLAILEEYAAADARVKVVRQENGGAGAARNAGMAAATGEWLFFSDADDFSGAEMLERMTTADGAAEADIVVAGHRTLENGKITTARLSQRLLGDHLPSEGVCRPWLFLDAGVMPWNKIFRRTFVQRHGIAFQTTMRHNDVRFVCCALAAADRIAVSNTCGYVYRRGRSGGITASSANGQDTFLFADVLASLRQELERMGLRDRAASAFANLALAHCYYHLLGDPDSDKFTALYSALHGHILADLGLKDADKSIFVNRKHYEYMVATLADETPVSLWMLLLKERYATWKDLCSRAEKISALQKSVAEDERRLHAASNKNASLQALADKAALRAKELEHKNADLQKLAREQSQRIEELESSNADLKRLVEEANLRIKELELDIKERDRRIAELDELSTRLQSLLTVSEDLRTGLKRQLESTLDSASYRIGRFVTWPFRALRDCLKKATKSRAPEQ